MEPRGSLATAELVVVIVVVVPRGARCLARSGVDLRNFCLDLAAAVAALRVAPFSLGAWAGRRLFPTHLGLVIESVVAAAAAVVD